MAYVENRGSSIMNYCRGAVVFFVDVATIINVSTTSFCDRYSWIAPPWFQKQNQARNRTYEIWKTVPSRSAIIKLDNYEYLEKALER